MASASGLGWPAYLWQECVSRVRLVGHIPSVLLQVSSVFEARNIRAWADSGQEHSTLAVKHFVAAGVSAEVGLPDFWGILPACGIGNEHG